MTPPVRSRQTGRAANSSDGGLNLESVLTAIGEAPDLAASRRRDMASAVRTIARLLGAEPAAIPASPRLLVRRLDEIAPAAHGLSAQRWANLRSLLRAGLALLGPIAPSRHLVPFTPGWQALWDAMPLDDRKLRIGLSRIMRFAGSNGIEPGDVADTLFGDFAAHLQNSLIKDPENALRSARYAWNGARQTVRDWPALEWPNPPRRPDHFSLPWSSFPDSLQREVQAWAAHLRGDNLLEIEHRPLRPTSVENRVSRLRGFASALVHRGRDPSSITSLSGLVEPATVRDGLRFYLERNGNRAGPGVADIAEILVAIARHWVKAPDEQVVELKRLSSRLRPERRNGLTDKNRARLHQLDDPQNLNALIHLPQRLLVDADARTRGVRTAVLAQTALAIELLLVAPVRISNLAAIDLDRHITRPGRTRGVVLLSFTDSEVKNSVPLDYPLPPSTITLLDHYLANYRPLLAPPGSTALFPALNGGGKSRAVLGTRISRTVFQYTGLKAHPHLFRHIAAKLQLEADPGSYELVRRVLAHRSLETTTRAYAGTESVAAVRLYDATLDRIRAAAPAMPPRKRRALA